jgi:hypothetical protein
MDDCKQGKLPSTTTFSALSRISYVFSFESFCQWFWFVQLETKSNETLGRRQERKATRHFDFQCAFKNLVRVVSWEDLSMTVVCSCLKAKQGKQRSILRAVLLFMLPLMTVTKEVYPDRGRATSWGERKFEYEFVWENTVNILHGIFVKTSFESDRAGIFCFLTCFWLYFFHNYGQQIC